jgi:hypothetical protein
LAAVFYRYKRNGEELFNLKKEGAGVIFRVYAEGADPKRDEPVAELGAVNNGGKAEAEWKPVETREKGDTKELKYFFTAAAQRAGKTESRAIAIKNPQILEMRWEPEFIYHEHETTLRLKTFEFAVFNPHISVQLFERNDTAKQKPLLEKELDISQDDTDISFTMDFSVENILTELNETDIELETKIVSESIKCIPPEEKSYLAVGVNTVHE